MNRFYTLGVFFLTLAFLTSCNQGKSERQNNKGQEEWVQLFNGEDLTGWTPKIRYYELGDNHGNTFRVEEGMIKVRYDEGYDTFDERFGHLLDRKSVV